MDMSDRALRLRVPATRDYLATIRLFGAAAAKHLGGDSDSAEDLRLALSEASGLAMAGAGEGSRIEVTLTPVDVGSGVQVEVRRDGAPGGVAPRADRDDGDGGEGGAEDGAGDLALALLRALVTDLSVDGEDPSRLAFSLEFGGRVSDMPTPEGSATGGHASDG